MKKNTYPKVFAIVLNYNGNDVLPLCLDSLYRSEYPNLEIVVVDNASKDGSLEDARKRFSRFHFIKNSKNIGFAAGNNVAIRFALEKMADYVFLLNNDATVDPDTIGKMVEEAEKDPSAGIFSPLILSPDGNVWFSGGKILWLKMKTVHMPLSESNYSNRTDCVSGCAMLVKKAVFKKIGLFDEKFFLYYEDADFSLRAKRAGFDLKIIPSIFAHHAEKSETENPAKLYWLVLSGLIFFKKNSSGLSKAWLCVHLRLRKFKNLLMVALRRSPASLEVRRAYQDYEKSLT